MSNTAHLKTIEASTIWILYLSQYLTSFRIRKSNYLYLKNEVKTIATCPLIQPQKLSTCPYYNTFNSQFLLHSII